MEEITIYKVFALANEEGIITSIEGTAFHSEQELIEKGYVQIDEGTDGTIYGHCQPNYLEYKYNKKLYDDNDIPNFKLVNGKVNVLSIIEKEEIEKEEPITNYDSQEKQLQEMLSSELKDNFLLQLPDKEAIKIPLLYDNWKLYIGKSLEQGKRFEYNGKLWKTNKTILNVLESEPPTEDEYSNYEIVRVEHDGSIDDAIPYEPTIQVFDGKYYIENGIKYKCIKNSEKPLYSTCSSLLNNYFILS